MKYTSFLIKFFLFSTALYLLWIPFASAYFFAVLKTTAAYFGLIGIEITLNPAHDYLYSQGIRSCIPPFIALVLATNLSLKKKALPKKKTQKIFSKPFCLRVGFPSTLFLKGLIIGIPILFFFRVILQISYVYLQIRPTGEFYSIFVIFLSGTCRVALPFLLWLALSYKQIYPLLKPEKYTKGESGLGDKRGYLCPFCGAEKVGILDHIKTVHGEEALKSEEVKQLLKRNLEIKRKK